MKRIQLIFAAVVAAAIMGLAPNARAVVQTCSTTTTPKCHYIGAGSSAQYLEAALAADKLAIQEISDEGLTGTKCPYHWVTNNSATIADGRDSTIPQEPGNTWIVWIADCSPNSGASNVTDIWLMVSVDSTVGVRAFMAQESTGSGAIVGSLTASASGNGIAQALWQDNNTDPTIVGNTTLLTAIRGGVIGSTTWNPVHINVGLTDIRPEDALFATTRSLAKLTSTRSGLGYASAKPTIGVQIASGKSGSSATATPVKFALSGNDPILKPTHAVRSYVTVPIGAAPIVFIANNATTGNPSGGDAYALNLISNIGSTGTTNKYAEKLFAGGNCKDNATAFSGGDPQGNNISVFLREPLSGTMNTTEFGVFRTKNNPNGSQELGVDPTATNNNPLNLPCTTGGNRVRGIGTGEIRDLVNTTPDSVGYIFFSFAVSKVFACTTGANCKINYLTVDGVDPLFDVENMNPGAWPGQGMPNCTTTQCPAVNISSPSINSVWGSSTTPNSYPHIRDGKYKVWSVYRWAVDSADYNSCYTGGSFHVANCNDQYGPTALAQAAQDTVDTTVADFVPFNTSDGTDGLTVYRSHFTRAPIPAAQVSNGPVAGNTRGGGTEKGGDEGGAIQGPFGVDATSSGKVSTTGKAATSGLCSGSFAVTWKSGDLFNPYWAGNVSDFSIAGSASFTVTQVATTDKLLCVSTNPGKHNTASGSTAYADYSATVNQPVSSSNVLQQKQ